MRFTEHELTAALTGAAKMVFAAQDKDVRRGRRDVDEAWQALTTLQRFRLLDALGDQVLPVLVGLPDVDVEPGTRPTYTDEEVTRVVEEKLGGGVAGRVRRALVVKGRVALVQAALAALPPRQDPDALIVPDHL
ncbi:hypothetical protein [Nocardioides marmotae]|uniref:Uncharacterized protein n=1 Tax=Nocardioides marmotae TaxID=2663857 RepID=A0A6I3JF89_9ACTN|nr:hypothetical protein [Nocardioides marmotae]MCR6033120.1 hypothetical protein [Gordonia jinghuaiqii]MBC9732621.1 hypothetical protein [Nocardioides marmotae]MTB83739.1 hypothetical protein [Nocardioides marmotae]MTB96772.1 hypothetical protein [Nocardioides marmotae]QKE03024.1 hypothetical protein HPC71_19630 [Nocardioides marmotae]